MTYEPGGSLGHRLDPRSKLCFQFGFAIAVFASPRPLWLVTLAILALASLAVVDLSPVRALIGYRYVLLLLALAPLVAGLSLGPPWFALEETLRSVRAVSRVVLVLLVSAAYVHSTPIRDTRAAVQRHVPGRPGQLLGVGIGLTFRYVPVVFGDVQRLRDAMRARNGEHRAFRDRVRLIVVGTVTRAFDRADRLAIALRARCFAWNPTLPELHFRPVDYLVLGTGVTLALAPLVRFLIGRL